MDLDNLHIFIGVMHRNSFAAVAREKNVAPSSVSRAIAALENELGIRLFQRSTRKLEPTEAGTAYFESIESIVEELEQSNQQVADYSAQPKGTLRISASVTFGRLSIVPLMAEFTRQYPQLRVDLDLNNAVVDVVGDRIDVAIRLGPLQESNMIARRLCTMEFLAVASPAYLARRGTPVLPHELAQHNCLLFPMPGFSSQWKFRDKSGKEEQMAVEGQCVISNAEALRDCALQHMGIALIPRWICWRELQDGQLCKLFPDYSVSATDFDSAVWLVYSSRQYLPLKVRVFIDYLMKKFENNIP